MLPFLRQKRVTAKGEYCSYAFLPLDGSIRLTTAGWTRRQCDPCRRSRLEVGLLGGVVGGRFHHQHPPGFPTGGGG